MANSLSAQNRIARAVAFKWEDMPGLCDHIAWAEETGSRMGLNLDEVPALVNPAENTGPTVSLRRPSRIDATLTTVGTDYSLPGVTDTPLGYQARVDATVPLTINIRAEANLQLSMEELSLYLTNKQGIERHIEPAVTSIKAQINKQIAYVVSQYAGQSVSVGSAQTNWSQNWLQAASDAHNLMVERNATTYDTNKLTALVPGSTYSYLNANAGIVFNYGEDIREAQAKGLTYNDRRLAGYSLQPSPLTGNYYVPVAPSSVVTTATAGVASGYAQTWTVPVSGLTASTTYKAGTVVGFSVSSANVNWINPLTKTDSGFQATFTLVSDATSSAGGTATFTLSEALVYGGAFQNTTLTAALPSGAAMTFINASTSAVTARNSFLFDKSAIVGVSPNIVVPKGVYDVKQWRQSGVGITIGSVTYPNTWQEMTKIVVLAGVAVLKPEGVTRLLNSK